MAIQYEKTVKTEQKMRQNFIGLHNKNADCLRFPAHKRHDTAADKR
jgi:hypothetical protein